MKEQDEADYIADACFKDSVFYLIQNRLYYIFPNSWDTDSYSDLLTLDEKGNLLEIVNLHGDLTKYMRILEAGDDYLLLVGGIKTDTCHYKLVISKYDLSSKALIHLSSLDFCDAILINIKIREGLHNQRFLEEYHVLDSNENLEKKIYRIEPDYSLTEVLDAAVIYETFSVDFSRKGYVISDVGLYHFYDANFNYRKQKFTDEFHGPSAHQTHTPFRHHLMLEQSVQYDHNDPDKGQQIRLVDSNLNVIKKLVILPSHPYRGYAFMPFYGGISIDNENEIWASAYYNLLNTGFFMQDSAFFTIMKLDSHLNIICQHFVGYDSFYRIFGINALPNGGAIAFGSRVRDGHTVNEGEDIYALRIGENCELPPIVATDDPGAVMHYISAYPNPGFNNLSFDVNGFDPSTLSVEMINTTGQLLFEKKDISYSIQVPDLPAGQYFYRIIKDGQLLGIGSWVKQ
jgi:hypothetical protein